MLLATAIAVQAMTSCHPPSCAESDEGNNESAPLIMPYLFCIE